MNNDEESLVLTGFQLPSTFPPEFLPERAVAFARAVAPGMGKADLVQLATRHGFDPLWTPLPHVGEGVYGFGIEVEGTVVPFMVVMRGAAQLQRSPTAIQ